MDIRVSIPSYSGVCCLLVEEAHKEFDKYGFQSLLIQGCVVWSGMTLGKRISRKGFNPFLFRGVLSGVDQWIDRKRHYSVSIPSYSGVCCLRNKMNQQHTIITFQSLLIQGCVV